MGISGIGPGSLILILVIVLLIFGTKRLKNLGGDLGGAIKGFKKAMSDETSAEKSDDSVVETSDQKQKKHLDDVKAKNTQEHNVSEKQK